MSAPPRLVLVIHDALPRWQIANIAIVLGATVGARGLVPLGVRLEDADGQPHEAIAEATVPVLTAGSDQLDEIATAAREAEVLVLDFNSAARDSRDYDEYRQALAASRPALLGMVLCGQRRAVTRITGNLKSLR